MFIDFYKEYVDSLNNVLTHVSEKELNDVFQAIDYAYQNGRKVFVLGNGGSTATASHWVCDMGKGINTENSRRMKISSPMDNPGLVTALANDISYDDVLSYQLKTTAEKDDLVIGLSVSGNSANIVKAMEYTKSAGCRNVSIIGDYNGRMADVSDITLKIDSKNYGIVEDIHLIINHIISQYIKKNNTENE